MRKPDDELKISVSEIFGGELPGPSDTLEDVVEAEGPGQPAPPSAEAESRFQEWMAGRNRELEARAPEGPRRPPEPEPPPPVPESDRDRLSAAELQAPEAPRPTAEDSPVDFNAPMAPPFMGGPPAEAPQAPPPSEAPPPTGAEAAEEKRLQAEYEFLAHYDAFRSILIFELKDLVGERKTLTMLERTFELAREKHPEIFRNANWDPEGNLLNDGSVDSQRVLENKDLLDPEKADAVLDAALSALLGLRLQAVEKGLGTGLKNKVRSRLSQWIVEKVQKAEREGKNPAYLKRLGGYLA